MLQDVVEGVTVCDALPHIDFVMSMFLPSDVEEILAEHQPEPLPEDIAQKVKAIVRRAEDGAGV